VRLQLLGGGWQRRALEAYNIHNELLNCQATDSICLFVKLLPQRFISTCSFSHTRASMSSQLCENAVNRPIQVQLDVMRSSNLVTVSFLAHLLHIPFQKRLSGLQLLFVHRSERGPLETLIPKPGVFQIAPLAQHDMGPFLLGLLWSNRVDRKHAVLDIIFRNE
jgi:hypothetical protein